MTDPVLAATSFSSFLQNDQNAVGVAYPRMSPEDAKKALRAVTLASGPLEKADPLSPDVIAQTLVDKTLLLELIEEKPNYAEGYIDQIRRSRLMYFRGDGVFFLSWSGSYLVQGTWSVIDETHLYIYYTMKDPDGATRIVTRVPTLKSFFETIFDSAEGDYCELGQGTTNAITLSANKFPESLESACARRKKNSSQ